MGTDVGLESLSQGLPKNLTRLGLDFHCNGNFTDKGLERLAAALPKSLVELSLDCLCNVRFSDSGLSVFAAALPTSLEAFHFAAGMAVRTSAKDMRQRYVRRRS